MIGVFAMIMTVIAYGLYSAGSGMLAVLVVAVAAGLWWATDAVEWDVEFLVGAILALVLVWLAFITIRAVFLTIVGWL